MRVLVTGAAGFMGSHLVDALLAQGHEVHGVDDLSGGFMRNVNPGSEFHELDLRDKDATDALVSEVRPEIVFHLAADATEGRSQFTPISAVERNAMAYANLLVPAIRAGMSKMVLASSMSVYGSQRPPFSEEMDRRPEDVYGVSKSSMEAMTEILSRVHGFRYCIIRPHNVYGPRQNMADPYRNVIAIFINRLMQGKPFYVYGDGEQTRAFSYIDDFTPYMLRAGFDSAADGQVFNIGPVESVSINRLSEVVLDSFYDGKPPAGLEPRHLPARPLEVKDAYCTVDKARKMLGYRTTVPLEDGIRKMVAWSRELGFQEPKYQQLELESGGAPQSWTKKLI